MYGFTLYKPLNFENCTRALTLRVQTYIKPIFNDSSQNNYTDKRSDKFATNLQLKRAQVRFLNFSITLF